MQLAFEGSISEDKGSAGVGMDVFSFTEEANLGEPLAPKNILPLEPLISFSLA